MERLLRDQSYKILKQDTIGKYFVSTVWLGLDHGWRLVAEREGLPYFPTIFETMVFKEDQRDEDDEWDRFQERYCTQEEALEGHAKVCEEVRSLPKTEDPSA